MSIASQYNAAVEFTDALLAMNHDNPTVRAIASRRAEEAFQRIVKARRDTADVEVSLDFRGEKPVFASTCAGADQKEKAYV